MESYHLTENRLDLASKTGVEIDFRPVGIGSAGRTLSIWTSQKDEADSRSDSLYIFQPTPATVMIRFPDSQQILFAKDVRAISQAPPGLLPRTQYYMTTVKDNDELIQACTCPDLAKAVLLLTKPLDTYPEIPAIMGDDCRSPIILGTEDRTAYLNLGHSDKEGTH
jgi:hypothetical protein